MAADGIALALTFGFIAGPTYWWWCELMGEIIVNHFGVKVGLIGEPDALLGRVVRSLPHRPLASRHRCDMPVICSHLSTADCHLVRLSSNFSIFYQFLHCLFRSLSVSSAGLSPRFRSRSSASDLADAGMVGWMCRMRLVGTDLIHCFP